MQVKFYLQLNFYGLYDFQNVIMDKKASTAATVAAYQQIEQESPDFVRPLMNSDSMEEKTAAGKDDKDVDN